MTRVTDPEDGLARQAVAKRMERRAYEEMTWSLMTEIALSYAWARGLEQPKVVSLKRLHATLEDGEWTASMEALVEHGEPEPSPLRGPSGNTYGAEYKRKTTEIFWSYYLRTKTISKAEYCDL